MSGRRSETPSSSARATSGYTVDNNPLTTWIRKKVANSEFADYFANNQKQFTTQAILDIFKQLPEGGSAAEVNSILLGNCCGVVSVKDQNTIYEIATKHRIAVPMTPLFDLAKRGRFHFGGTINAILQKVSSTHPNSEDHKILTKLYNKYLVTHLSHGALLRELPTVELINLIRKACTEGNFTKIVEFGPGSGALLSVLNLMLPEVKCTGYDNNDEPGYAFDRSGLVTIQKNPIKTYLKHTTESDLSGTLFLFCWPRGGTMEEAAKQLREKGATLLVMWPDDASFSSEFFEPTSNTSCTLLPITTMSTSGVLPGNKYHPCKDERHMLASLVFMVAHQNSPFYNSDTEAMIKRLEIPPHYLIQGLSKTTLSKQTFYRDLNLLNLPQLPPELMRQSLTQTQLSALSSILDKFHTLKTTTYIPDGAEPIIVW